jgi:hypothetical protein
MPRPVGPSSGVTSRPSFVSGSADTMERQIKKRKDDVYRQTLANLAKLEQEKQNDDGGFSVGGAFKAFGKGLGGLIVSPAATALDTMDWANQQLEKYVAGKEPEDQYDPADAYSYNLFGETYRGVDAGLQRAGGDIAAIPGVGEPSASPTASDIRNYGVLEGVARAGIDYGNLAATVYPVAKAGAVNAGLVTPTPSPFKPLTLDQVPATAPTTPYSQIRAALAEDMARVPEPTIPRQQIAPRLQVPSQFPNVPPMPPGFPLPRVPDNMDFYDLWRSPEGMSYFRAGETINPRETIDFAFDPEMAYLVHSGRPELVGNVLDPFRNLSGLNDNHLRGVALGHDNAIRSAEIMEEALDNFVRTGVWNGNEIIESMPSRYGRELGEVDLREAIKASDMSDQQLQEFVDTIQTRINRFRDYVSRTRPYLALSRREPFMSYYPATVGGHEGYARWHSGGQGGAMYLAGVPSERATSLFGPGIYEKKLGVPEWQAFGQQRPIASLSGFPRDFWGNAEYNLSRAFAIQKVIENRIARGLYKDGPIRVTAPDTPAPAGLASTAMQDLAQAQAANRIGTVSRGPVETLSSEAFPQLSVWLKTEGGVPDPSMDYMQTYQLPVYNVNGKKIAFGTKGVGRFEPEFKAADVEIMPFNPYTISGHGAESQIGQQYGELFFDAIQGSAIETNFTKENLGQVPALLYAASRGDRGAMQELQRLAMIGNEARLAARAADKATGLNFMGLNPETYQWPNTVFAGRDEYGQSIYRPAEIDDLFLVHQTTHKPRFDKDGNVILNPSIDFDPIDPVTGQVALDPVTGKVATQTERDTIHFTLNHLAGSHMARTIDTDSYAIVVPLRDVLEANPGSLDNLYAIDTYLTPKPGDSLRIPMTSGKVVDLPVDSNPDAIVGDALREVGIKHNKNDEYQTLGFASGSHYSSENVDRRVRYLAMEEIPKQYPEYEGGVGGSIHQGSPQWFGEEALPVKPASDRRSWLSPQWWHRLSPNFRLRMFSRDRYTTGTDELTEPSASGRS